jgi:type II secretory pathway component PulJ
MSKITVQELDRRIGDLRAVVDRSSASLVELDSDMTLRLLQTSTSLRGATATAWADASQRHTGLWRRQFALDALLARITDERGARKTPSQAALLRLDTYLDASCVEVPRGDGQGLPRLTEGPSATVPSTIDDALTQMSSDYDIVAQLVSSVAEAWGQRTEELRELAAAVTALDVHLREAGLRRPNELRTIGDAIAELEAVARDDPLALDATAIDELQVRAQRIASLVHDEVRENQQRHADRLAARECIEAALELVKDCRDQLRRSSEKVVVRDDTWRALDTFAEELGRLRSEAEKPAHADGSGIATARGLRDRADLVSEDVRRFARSEGAGLRRRDELRGLLGAYLAKAQAIGLGEDGEVDRAYAAARDALYAAPCDLDAAERLVADFQQAMRRRGEGSS